MKHSLGLLTLILFLVGCQNNKKNSSDLINQEDVFSTFEDTIVSIELKESKILLPFTNNLATTKKLKPDTLYVNLKGAQKYMCNNDYLLYIPFPSQGNRNIIAVSSKCDGYNYRYTLLSIDKDSVVSDLLIEAEYKDKTGVRKSETTSFEIDKDYQIKVTTMSLEDNSQYFTYETYQIGADGRFVKKADSDPSKNSSCFVKNSNVPLPLTSDDLFSLNYRAFTCSNIEGMKNYACHDGINYVTLKHTEDGLYYILVYTECGDSSYADLLVVQNDRVVSGLTIDSATYTEGDSDNLSGEEITFQIDQDFTITVTHSIIKHGDVASEKKTAYTINKDGRINKV